MTDEEHGRSRGLSPAAAGLLAVLGGALSWVAWLSWPISGNTYHPAQVVACALTCALIAVILAGRSTRAALVTVPLGGTAGVAIPWAWWASRSDETGLGAVARRADHPRHRGLGRALDRRRARRQHSPAPRALTQVDTPT